MVHQRFDFGYSLGILRITVLIPEHFLCNWKEICLDFLTSDDLSSLDQFQSIRKHLNFGGVDSEPVAVKALGFHQPIHIFNHERIIKWSHKRNMPMMSWTVVARHSACWACSSFIEWWHSHPLVVQAVWLRVVKMIESLSVGHLDTWKLRDFVIGEKWERHARKPVFDQLIVNFKHSFF